MSETSSGRTGGSGVADERTARQQRLAAALRDNLRRRKAQSRARAADPALPAAPTGKTGEGEDDG